MTWYRAIIAWTLCLFGFILWPAPPRADVSVGCFSDQLLAEFSEGVSVEDMSEGSATTQLILQLPIRYSNLELEVIHLRRFDREKRTLWSGLPFEELNESRSWSSVEIARADLKNYKFFAQYRSTSGGEGECTYEFPIALNTVNTSATRPPLPDPLEAGWQGAPVCVQLQDNADQRVLRCSFPPAVGHERHFHSRHFGYAISGGRMRITDSNGTRDVDLETGSYFASDGVAWHEVLNVGDTTVVYLIVEPK